MKTTIATRSGLVRWALPVCLAIGAMGLVNHYTAATPAVRFSPQPTIVATVDLVRLMSGLNKAAALNMQQIKRNEERQKSLDEMAAKVKQYKEELDALPKTADKERRELFVTAYEQEQTTTARKEALQRVITIEQGELIRELYQDVQTAAQAFAAKNGYDLVIVDDRALELPQQATRDQMNMVIQNKRILFAADTMDITNALMQDMNNQYQAPPGTPAPAAATTPPATPAVPNK